MSGILVFKNNEVGYLRWILENQPGFVINTPRSMPATYMTLHRASCRHISIYHPLARAGGFTERDYIKVCAEQIDDLREWVRHHGRPDGSFTGACMCQP